MAGDSLEDFMKNLMASGSQSEDAVSDDLDDLLDVDSILGEIENLSQSGDIGAPMRDPDMIDNPNVRGNPADDKQIDISPTMKSRLTGGAPKIGETIKPIDKSRLDGFASDIKTRSAKKTSKTDMMSDTSRTAQAVDTAKGVTNKGVQSDKSSEEGAPFQFPAKESDANEIEETVKDTRKILKIIGIAVLGILLIFIICVGIGRKVASIDTKSIQKPVEQVSQTPVAVDTYTGPRLMTASPDSLAVSDSVFEDTMAVTKEIQAENGTVECYLVGVPQHFNKKIKIPVSVREYNNIENSSILTIRYRVVKISGADYVIESCVVYSEE